MARLPAITAVLALLALPLAGQQEKEKPEGGEPAPEKPTPNKPTPDEPTPDEPVTLAIIVNPKNPTTNLKLADLRAYFKADRTFWPNGKRIQLYLRKSGSPEMQILLDDVYEMSASRLRRYLRGKNFRGEVTGGKAYTIAPSTDKAIARVKANVGAISVVLASEVKEGVRVLSIDGKRPGDEGYPLVAAPTDSDEMAG